jgi:hydroxyethylthiazole kinase-like uncharacterized protein yjeF
MRQAHAVSDVRTAEDTLMETVPDGALMQRAAAGLAAICAQLLGRVYGSRVAVLAGTGANGGDALYAAARLARRGARVTVIQTGSHLYEGGWNALKRAGGRLTEDAGQAAANALAEADLVLDGILGIGGRGGLREPAANLAGLAERARAAGAILVATDLPSGVDADTGVVSGAAIRADVTVTFGTLKPGLLIDPGASYAGTVELVDIGLEPALAAGPVAIALQSPDVAGLLPTPSVESDKYRRGVLGVLAGSDKYTGAAVLSVGGAIRGGAGMVRLVSSKSAADVVRQHWPEAVITHLDPGRPAASIEAAGRVQAWVAGPGLGTGDEAEAVLEAVLGTDLPVLIDADGLTVLRRNRELLSRAGGGGVGGGGPGPPRQSHPNPAHPARRRTSPPPRRQRCRHRGQPARLRPSGGRRARRHGPAQGLDHGRRDARRRRPGLREPDRHPLAGHRRLRRRPHRPGRRPARPGRASGAGRRSGRRLPARPGRPPSRQ